MSHIKTGEIWAHNCFYRDADNECKRKYILILYSHESKIIFRVLTSQQNVRNHNLGCHHDENPSFYIDTLDGVLDKSTWVVLTKSNHNTVYDEYDFQSFVGSNHVYKYKDQINKELLEQIIECCIGADDTTKGEERCLRDFINKINGISQLDEKYS